MSDLEDQAKREKRERKEKKELKKKEKEAKKAAKESKKRSADEIEEIAIDLEEPAPLSKKQKRLIRQGKLTLEEVQEKSVVAAPAVEETDDTDKESKEAKEKKDKSEFGVWIGNLSFDTTKEDLTRFLVGKTSGFEEDGEFVKITESDITRVNLPKKEKKIKGFAYVDFTSQDHVKAAISLSEEHLNGRNLLIKDAHSFEGRPAKDPLASISKNPPSRILFVGNLSFDTTKELLEEHFQSCGEIVKIRMATFEDSGKCKGFAFVDFKDEKGPTAALTNKIYKKLIHRPLRLEFGEDRSKRNPTRRPQPDAEGEVAAPVEQTFAKTNEARERIPHEQQHVQRERKPPVVRAPRHFQDDDRAANQRLKSSVALANAQRASAAIVKSTGKKVTFD